MFKRYMHIERFGNEEVQGIELGKTYIFPKLDGTNASIWSKTGQLNLGRDLFAGSRNRQLYPDNDNAGFYNHILKDADLNTSLLNFFDENPRLRLYGEWLVPHTLKTYRENAWKRFWVFDVFNDDTDQYLTYDTYKPLLDKHVLDYIPPLQVVTNGSYEDFIHVLNQNNFFIKDGEGIGEGIVIKNYDFYNKHGNQVWAKIISSEFKEANHKLFNYPTREVKLVEEQIVNKYITEALCTKVKAKIMNEEDGWSSKYIPRLLDTIFYDLIKEESWEFIKEYKQPTINYKTLKALVTMRIKQLLPEIF